MSKEEKENSLFETPCPECRAGLRRLKYLTFYLWERGELITVPNFPAWVCDLCGLREYDTRAQAWLNTLLHTPYRRSGAPRIRRERGDHPPVDTPTAAPD